MLSPRMLVVHVLALAAILFAGLLGKWQFDVWSDHRDDQAARIAQQAPRPLDDVLGPDAAFTNDAVGRPVSFTGRWDDADTTVVRSGGQRWLVTPVRLGDSAILVARGSIAAGQNGQTGQTGQTGPGGGSPVNGLVTVTGWLQPSSDGGEGSVGVRVADFVQKIDTDLYSGYVIVKTPLDPALAPITLSQLPKPDSFTSIRNLLYALEWWVFAAFAAFVWWRWCRDEVARVNAARSVQDAPTAPAA